MKKILLLVIALLSFTQMSAQTDSTETSKLSETDKALAGMINKAMEVAETTGQFVIDQAPDLIKQFYRWHLYSNIFWMVLCIISVFLAYKLVRSWGKKEENHHYDEPFLGRFYYDNGPAMIVFFITSLFAVIGFIINLYDTIYLLSAPKLYIIDYFIGR